MNIRLNCYQRVVEILGGCLCFGRCLDWQIDLQRVLLRYGMGQVMII